MSDYPSHDQNADSNANQTYEADLEKQRSAAPSAPEPCASDANHAPLTIIVSSGEPKPTSDALKKSCSQEELADAGSPKKEFLSRTSSSNEQCRICQQDKEEVLIELGCQCRGGLAKAHLTCIETWFRAKGSNKCEICQVIAVNIPAPQSQPSTNYWIWRIDPAYRTQDSIRCCFNPLWLAFTILIGGLLLDILLSITLGVSALPVNIIIGIIVVLGLGTVFRLALEFFNEWSASSSSTRVSQQRVETNLHVGYYPAI